MSEVAVSVVDGIATITLNRPDTLNSLSGSVLEALGEAIGQVESQPSIRAAIVTGEGRAFAAGADIEEISQLDASTGRAFALHGQGVFSRLEQLDKPTLAAVNGFALGGGCELAMSCHLRVASNRARFGQPEVKLGILPGFGGTQRLPRLVGRTRATEMILTGRPIKAEEALRIGLVNEVVEPDALLERSHALLRSALENGPKALAASLRAIAQGLEGSLEAGLHLEATLFGETCGTDEMKEGTRAFLEKRAPKF